MFKFLNKALRTLYLLNILMDQADAVQFVRYRLEVLFCTIATHLEINVTVTVFVFFFFFFFFFVCF